MDPIQKAALSKKMMDLMDALHAKYTAEEQRMGTALHQYINGQTSIEGVMAVCENVPPDKLANALLGFWSTFDEQSAKLYAEKKWGQ